MTTTPFPDKKYSVIYADPPWSYYNDRSARPDCTTVRGMRRPPYSVMGSREIMKLPVGGIAEDDSILFIWTTDYHLEKCIGVIQAWGFSYKTVGFVWSKKTKKNKQVCFMGAYTMKSGTELCLLATKGKNAHKLVRKHNVKSYLEGPRREHSKKPDEVRDRIVDLVGDVPRIELFARERFDGWDAWGDEVTDTCDICGKHK